MKPSRRIVGAAAVDALPLGLAPGRSRADFVDRAHGFRRSLLVVESLGVFPEMAGRKRDRIGGTGAQLKRRHCRPEAADLRKPAE